MTTDEIQVLLLKLQHLDQIKPRAVQLVAQLVDQFLDGSEPPLEGAEDDDLTGGLPHDERRV